MLKEIAIHEIECFQIGNAEDVQGGTGCTAIVCPDGAFTGVSVRGGAPATRETDLLNPVNMVEKTHCVMLSGGSAYGLAAAEGAMQYLEEKNIGFDVPVGKVPIIPSACLFDLGVGDPKCRPDGAMGYAAMKNAEINRPQEGNHGAGTGATVGKLLGAERSMKSGLGIYGVELGPLKVGAVVAVNALGNVCDADTNQSLAGLLSEDKTKVVSTRDTLYAMVAQSFDVFQGNTTLGCIITNAKLTKTECTKVASMAHNGYARSICPVHTTADGDSIFVMSHGEVEVMLDVVGTLAADVMARAVKRGVLAAKSAYGFLGAEDINA